MFVAPVNGWYLPKSQNVQALEPTWSLYAPTEQEVQEDDPRAEYLPEAQEEQLKAPLALE